MNTNHELDDLINEGWRQLKEAAATRDWTTTQKTFHELATFQNLHEQSRNLQERIRTAVQSQGESRSAHPDPQPLGGSTVAYADGRRRRTIRPRELRIGAHRIPVSVANQIPIETATWILEQGKALPTIPNVLHPTNSGFAQSAQTKRLKDGSYIEIGDSQDVLIQKARKLLNASGFRGLRIEVLLEDGAVKTA